MEEKGFGGEVVGEEIVGEAQWFDEDVAEPGILCLEIGDFASGRLKGPEPFLWVEDADLPEVLKVAGEFLKDDVHSGPPCWVGQDAPASCPAEVRRFRLKRFGRARPKRGGFFRGPQR